MANLTHYAVSVSSTPCKNEESKIFSLEVSHICIYNYIIIITIVIGSILRVTLYMNVQFIH